MSQQSWTPKSMRVKVQMRRMCIYHACNLIDHHLFSSYWIMLSETFVLILVCFWNIQEFTVFILIFLHFSLGLG